MALSVSDCFLFGFSIGNSNKWLFIWEEMSAKASQKTTAKKAPVKRKAAKGYKLPDPIRNGEILKDGMKKEWQIGPSIGIGGFGEIYSASDITDSPKKKASFPYAVKIEPHGNGPLFVEMHFYIKVAKPIEIESWMKNRKLKVFGMPRYLGSGSHEYNGEKYRFVVMDRYGKDLWSIFLENSRIFPYPTVLRIGLQVLDVLEYIHSKSYVHADIKGGNLLLGLKKGTENHVYVVDFGLACRYSENEYKPDPKNAHNGTIEYTSRDAHNGAAIVKYFEYVASLMHNNEPDYVKCRKILESGLKDCKCPLEGKLEFKMKGSDAKSGKHAVQNQKENEESDDEDESVDKKNPKKAFVSGVQKANRGRPKKKIVNNSVTDLNDEIDTNVSGKDESNGKMIDKSRFVYRAGEYKRLPPEQRPYGKKKQKKEDA
ncbi:Nucleosomal histone kinase 1 [Blattella germanica]|nr:Nucleosomal histone kinase 1 [Blattella germanica]